MGQNLRGMFPQPAQAPGMGGMANPQMRQQFGGKIGGLYRGQTPEGLPPTAQMPTAPMPTAPMPEGAAPTGLPPGLQGRALPPGLARKPMLPPGLARNMGGGVMPGGGMPGNQFANPMQPNLTNPMQTQRLVRRF